MALTVRFADIARVSPSNRLELSGIRCGPSMFNLPPHNFLEIGRRIEI